MSVCEALMAQWGVITSMYFIKKIICFILKKLDYDIDYDVCRLNDDDTI